MQRLKEKTLSIVLLSGPSDAELAQQLYLSIGRGAVVVAGGTTLLESVTLLSRADAFCGNDSGPGHIAGALGIPTVALFIAEAGADPDTLCSPGRFHPIGPRVACCAPAKCLPPCVDYCKAKFPHCIEGITVDQVLAAIDQVTALAPLSEMDTCLSVQDSGGHYSEYSS